MSVLTLSKNKLINRYLKKADVLLTVCTHRTIDIDVLGNIMQLLGLKHNFIWNPVRGDADISRSRSRAASYFLMETNHDCIFFIDDDVLFSKEDVSKIVDHVMNGKLICGGMYVQKGTLDKTLVLEKDDSVVFSKDAEVKKVVAISTGFMCIHRSVFEKLIATKKSSGNPLMPLCHATTNFSFYPFFDSQPMKMEDGSWIFASEDWSFCLQARNIGIDTWIDPSILIGHKGEYVYDLRDRVREVKKQWDDVLPLMLT